MRQNLENDESASWDPQGMQKKELVRLGPQVQEGRRSTRVGQPNKLMKDYVTDSIK